MNRFHAAKGVIITTFSFSEASKDYIQHIGKTLILIDGPRLVEPMLQYEVGVTASESYKIYRLNTEYYELI
jgi:restriction system protein